SLADIANAVNRMLVEDGQTALPHEIIRGFVGNGLPKLVERVIHHCGLDVDRHSELTRITLAHYNNASADKTLPYPGVPQALTSLRDMGCALGVCTNKPEKPARHVLQALDLSQYFDVVVGGDSLSTRKPDPAHLITTFDALPSGPRLYVGDSEVDAETARRAEIPFLLFTEGYRKTPVTDMPHTALYDDSADLPDLVRKVLIG
ncbi:MAG: phosphoglycolate phosphatase, partial [Ruegeria sp.]